MTKYSTVLDIISASLDDKPLDVNKFFYDLMKVKTYDYVNDKVEEIIAPLSNDEDDEEELIDTTDEDENTELDDEDFEIEVEEVDENEIDQEELNNALNAVDEDGTEDDKNS